MSGADTGQKGQDITGGSAPPGTCSAPFAPHGAGAGHVPARSSDQRPMHPDAVCRSESRRRRKTEQAIRSWLLRAQALDLGKRPAGPFWTRERHSRCRPAEDGDKPTVEVVASSELATERGKNLEPVAHKPAYGWLRGSAPLRPGPLVAGCSTRSNGPLPDALCRNGKGRLNAQFGYRPGNRRQLPIARRPALRMRSRFHGRSAGRSTGARCGAPDGVPCLHVTVLSHGPLRAPATYNCSVARPLIACSRHDRAPVPLAGR